jgi:DNA polymerase-3 subunit epsilon
MYPIIFLDTETTDLDPDTSAVIEVGMIRREKDGTETRFHTLIKPTEQELADAHPKALEINGYSADPSRWGDAPAMSEAGPQIVAFAEDVNTICGHNVGFDENMLKAAFKKHGVDGRIPYHKIDTVTLAYEHLFPLGLKSASLDRIRDFLGWSREGAHTAMKDTEDAMKLFNLLWRMTPTLRTHLARQIDEYHSLVMLGLSRKGYEGERQ